MKKGAENEDILFEEGVEDEFEIENDEGNQTTAQNKIKKLRTELKKAKIERDENLAGWQRSKADLANFRRIVEEDREKYKARAKVSLIYGLLPALDTFDAAMQDPSWADVEKNWREGVERIAQQFHQVLRDKGLVAFGAVGDIFDPNVHECMSTIETLDIKKDDTIAQVLQQGYEVNNELVRPAKVVVAQLAEHK